MLRLFRKFRQQEISQVNLAKYILYAIGEILLVVIGILIAIQINNWVEEKNDRVQEQKYLNNFHDNLERDSENLEFRITNLSEALTIIDTVIEQMSVESPEGDVSELIGPLYMATFILVIERSTIEDLKSTGNLDLITNEQLTEALLTYYLDIEGDGLIFSQSLVEYSRNTIGPYLMKYYRFKLGPIGAQIPIQTEHMITYEKLKNDIFLINALIYRKGILSASKEAYVRALERNKNLRMLVASELD